MIVDRLENIHAYGFVGGLLQAGCRFLQSFDRATADGRIDIQGDDCYALIQTVSPEGPERRRFEAHRRYLDVQWVFQGRECIYVDSSDGLTVDTQYEPANDIEFFRDPPRPSTVILEPGDFALFYPQDAHKPCCYAGDSSRIRKVVLKILIGGKPPGATT